MRPLGTLLRLIAFVLWVFRPERLGTEPDLDRPADPLASRPAKGRLRSMWALETLPLDPPSPVAGTPSRGLAGILRWLFAPEALPEAGQDPAEARRKPRLSIVRWLFAREPLASDEPVREVTWNSWARWLFAREPLASDEPRAAEPSGSRDVEGDRPGKRLS